MKTSLCRPYPGRWWSFTILPLSALIVAGTGVLWAANEAVDLQAFDAGKHEKVLSRDRAMTSYGFWSRLLFREANLRINSQKAIQDSFKSLRTSGALSPGAAYAFRTSNPMSVARPTMTFQAHRARWPHFDSPFTKPATAFPHGKRLEQAMKLNAEWKWKERAFSKALDVLDNALRCGSSLVPGVSAARTAAVLLVDPSRGNKGLALVDYSAGLMARSYNPTFGNAYHSFRFGQEAFRLKASYDDFFNARRNSYIENRSIDLITKDGFRQTITRGAVTEMFKPIRTGIYGWDPSESSVTARRFHHETTTFSGIKDFRNSTVRNFMPASEIPRADKAWRDIQRQTIHPNNSAPSLNMANSINTTIKISTMNNTAMPQSTRPSSFGRTKW